jgi:hypothetical protein
LMISRLVRNRDALKTVQAYLDDHLESIRA